MAAVSTVRIPKYCHHLARDLAYVRLGSKVVYLGKYGSPNSKVAYGEHVAAWMGSGRPATGTVTVQPTLAVSQPATGGADDYMVIEFVRDFLAYAKIRYAKHKDFDHFKEALRPMLKLWGETPLTAFGPKRLREVRDAIITQGICRREINRRVRRIRKAVAWAVAEERCPGEVLYRLQALELLRYGEAPVPEPEPVKPVEPAIVDATLPFLSREVQAMVQVQRLTGARSGEVVTMRAVDIDMTGDVWVYRPAAHKTAWRGHKRAIAIGPRGQKIIQPFLTGDSDAYLFSAANAVEHLRVARHAVRKTPLSCGNVPGSHCSHDPQRTPGTHYGVNAYGRAVTVACQRAFPVPARLGKQEIIPTGGRKHKPRLETDREWKARLTQQQMAEVVAWRSAHHWHPHQLRHFAATLTRQGFGLEGAQAVLGHASIQATQIYAEARYEKSVEIMRAIG